MIDLSTVPLIAMSTASKEIISTLLNPLKLLPCEDGLPRDWRGLAHLLNINREFTSLLTQHSNPTMYMLTMPEQNQKNTIKDLQTMLEQIGRWDIIDRTEALFENDAAKHLEQQERAQVSADIIEHNVDQEILTSGDIYRLRQGLKTQYYDAFLLYADEDASFANEAIQKLEIEYKLKLCLKDRDLIVGVKFEHEALMKLISERCNRLLIIISPNFMKSSVNTFFLNYAQALSIENQQRKIIPCMYKNCQLPPQLRYMFILDYNRKGLYDFWGKLRDSIQAPTKQISAVQVAHDNIISTTSEVREMTNNYKHSNISQICQKTDKELLTYSQQETADCTMEKVNDIKTSNIETNKNRTLLQRLKNTGTNWKKQPKQNQQIVTETLTVNKLPSLDNLDDLNLSSTTIHDKKKKNVFNKFTRTVQMKKTAMKL